jgi:hypothetical protein
MTKRSPPALATWLVEHFASDYQRDSLLGDLIEQYNQGGSRFWYWKQVVAALVVASARMLPTLAVSAARILLRLAAESVAVIGLVSLPYELRGVDTPADFVRSTLIVTIVLVALIACLPLRATITRNLRKRKSPTIKRLLAAFAAITLGAATLTWAATTTLGSPTRSDPAVCIEHR